MNAYVLSLTAVLLASTAGPQNDAPRGKDDVVTVKGCISGNQLKLARGDLDSIAATLNASEYTLEGSKEVLRTLKKDHAGHYEEITGTLKLPPGSLVNPSLPAAVNARTATVKLACNAILGAWSQAASGTGVAPHAGVATVLALSGTRIDGRRWMFTEIIASGAGASVAPVASSSWS